MSAVVDEMIKLDIASSDDHFKQILNLQRRYHAQVLAPEIQAQGFETISRYSDGREEWVVVAWPLVGR